MKGPELRAVLVPLALGLALGAVGGWLWWTWWGPPPVGKVYETQAGPTWYPDPFDPGVTRDFTGTATFVVLGFGLALVLGLLGGWIARHRAVPGLAAVLLASVAAAALMTLIGLSQSPPDPQARADDVEIGTTLPGHLEVANGRVDLPTFVEELFNDDDGVLEIPTPYLTWPVGALLGHMILMLSVTSEWRRPEQPSAVPAQQV
ncbi:hypothetical protein [Nocardioides sp. Root190]|uniref:hypothetical protein n=1 Tax=Nocardioides sp. Root190 TaxID=1736488 RepID=UPI00138F6B0E|nr:hypothetical protein [Nocardioides sp. Root190]